MIVLEERSIDTLDWQKDEQVGSRANLASNISNSLKYLAYFRHVLRRQGSLEKTTMLGKQKAAGKENTKYEIGWLHNRGHKHECAGVEQGCRGQDSVDI